MFITPFGLRIILQSNYIILGGLCRLGGLVGGYVDEIIKDVDVLQHSLRNSCEDYYYFDSRMQGLINEIIS